MNQLRLRIVLTVFLGASLASGLAQAAPRRSDASPTPAAPKRPDTFGVDAYTVTALSDLSFTAFDDTTTVHADPGDYFRYTTGVDGGSFVTGAVIPAGAVIDYIGLGACDPVGGSFSVSVYEVDVAGNLNQIALFPSSQHTPSPCSIDYNATALDHQILYNAFETIQIQVIQQPTAPTDGSARFSGVEIWWHRSISPAPAVATFNDVPTGHPFFQYIEALAASGITGGCGNGNYCPDAPLTRGQMAVFLSKALGLHFSGIPAF